MLFLHQTNCHELLYICTMLKKGGIMIVCFKKNEIHNSYFLFLIKRWTWVHLYLIVPFLFLVIISSLNLNLYQECESSGGCRKFWQGGGLGLTPRKKGGSQPYFRQFNVIFFLNSKEREGWCDPKTLPPPRCATGIGTLIQTELIIMVVTY